MSVITYQYYRVIFEEDQILPVLKSLVATSSFEPTKPLKSANIAPSTEKISSVNEKLESFQKLKTFCEEIIREKKLKGIKKVKTDNKYFKNLTSEVENFSTRSEKLLAQIEEIKQLTEKITKLENNSDVLVELESIDLKVLGLKGKIVATSLGYVKLEDKEKVENYLEAFEDFSGSWISESDKGSYILLVTNTNNKDSLTEFIKVNKTITEISLYNPNSHRSPADLSKWNNKKLTELSSTRSELEQETEDVIKDIYPHIDSITNLIQLEADAYQMADFIESYENMDTESGQKMYELRGWIDPTVISTLQRVFKQFESSVELEELQSSKRDDIRTGIKNNSLFRPFEMITGLMGTPSTKEIDPSAYMAIFFVIFFGFALGDSGYGLLLLIGFGIMYFKKYTDDGMREASKLMIYCAITTIIFGLLSGGFFGNLEVQDNNPFADFLLQFKLYDIEESLMTILLITLAAGFFQQVFGIVLKMVSEIRNKNYYEALSKSGTWLLLFASIGGYLFASSYDVDGLLRTASIVGLGLSLALFAIGQGDSKKPLLIRPFIGIFSIFNITSYLSNTLSYARLLALGLATGVIATVINLIANIVADPSKPVGLVIFILILIVGHLFNLALNLLGTSINIVRLQLVEFFPRFYEAKGTPLTPVKSQIDLESLPLGYIKNNLLK